MAIGTTKHPSVGQRVEIPAYADMWMRGARFGVVERVIDRSNRGMVAAEERTDIFRVRLDHPQARRRLYSYVANDCRTL